MANINRDYLIINDVKKSNVKLDNGSMNFYITDKNTQNIFVNLVINTSKNELITKYANIENADDYTVTMNIVKPDNTYKVIEGQLHSKEEAIFEFDLPADCCDQVGTYRCELLTKCNINSREEITTSNKVSYKVKASVLNDLDDIVDAPEYPLVIQLFDKLSDIDQYEEDRRANEIARQLAEEQRQQRFDTLIKALEIDNEERDSKIANLEAEDIVQNNRLNNLEVENAVVQNEITTIKSKNTEQDRQLDVVENRLDNINTNIEDVLQPTVQRVDAIEAIDVAQNNRLDVIEAKNSQQDDRLLDIEKVNKKQDKDIKCLFNLHTVDIAEEGNGVYLQNSAEGYCEIDNIQGNTLVNCNKEPNKELILNGNINTSGDNTVTITEGVDGGLVDVSLEGNTMVNVCDQKDPVAITKSYTVETGNHVALQGEYDGKCRPVVTGNTLVNLYDISYTRVDGQCVISDNKITCTTTTNKWSNFFNNNKDIFKPSTNYTIIVDVSKNTLTSGSTVYITSQANGSNRDIFDNSAQPFMISGGITGLFKKVMTTLDSFDNSSYALRSYISNNSSTEGNELELSIIILEGNYTNKPIPKYFTGLQSSFEDKVVTQEMVDAGEELAENLGKYKVDYVISKEDGTVGFTKTFYLNSPLLERDTIEQQGDNVVHVHRGELRAYQTDDELTLPTDKTNTLVAKATPTYEVILQNDTILCDSYVNGHLDVDSAVPIEKVMFIGTKIPLKYQCVSTQYLVKFEADNNGIINVTYFYGTSNPADYNIPVAKGLNKINLLTGNGTIGNQLYFDGIGFNASNIVVTQATDQNFGYFEGMKSVGECEDLEVVSSNSDSSQSNTQTLTHQPLRAVGDVKDKYVLIDSKWYIERNCGVRAYQEGDMDNYLTDMINTVYPLSIPTYEPIDYNPFTVYSGATHISNNSTIPCNMTIKNTGFNCILKPSTTYTVSSNLGLNTVTTPSTLTEDCLRFYDTDTSDVTTMRDVMVLEGDYTTGKPLPSMFSGMESAFEQEYDEAVGKYKVKIRVQNEDATKENYIEFHINEPLRGIENVKDKVYVKDNKVVVQRNCGIRAYEDGDFGTYPTDKVNTVYTLASPTYEEVEYDDVKLSIETFKNSTLFYNSNVPVTSKLYYTYSVPLVDTVTQTASISDQQDRMIIDMATQVAVMEMMLM